MPLVVLRVLKLFIPTLKFGCIASIQHDRPNLCTLRRPHCTNRSARGCALAATAFPFAVASKTSRSSRTKRCLPVKFWRTHLQIRSARRAGRRMPAARPTSPQIDCRELSETLQPIGEVLKSPILSAGVGSKLHTQGGRRPLLLLSAGVIPAPPFAATATAEPNCSPDFENAGPARLMLGSAGISPMPCCLADMPAWARLRC